MIRRATVLTLALIAIASGCESPGTRLLLAENSLTAAQDGWTGLLQRGVVKDRTSIITGTAAFNAAGAAVEQAKAAYRHPTTTAANGSTIETLPGWVDTLEDAVDTALRTYAQIRAQHPETKTP